MLLFIIFLSKGTTDVPNPVATEGLMIVDDDDVWDIVLLLFIFVTIKSTTVVRIEVATEGHIYLLLFVSSSRVHIGHDPRAQVKVATEGLMIVDDDVWDIVLLLFIIFNTERTIRLVLKVATVFFLMKVAAELRPCTFYSENQTKYVRRCFDGRNATKINSTTKLRIGRPCARYKVTNA